MEYNRIIAISGLSGLFELLSSKTDGAIVRSLEDNTTRFVSSRVHNFSHLESIEIYTLRDNVNLVDVLQAMEKSSKPLPDGKDANLLKAYFKEVFPEMDLERVYSSDMKKMVKWFEILQKNKIEIKLSEVPEETEEVTEAEEKPVKKTAAKTEAPVEIDEPAKKKAAPKKAAKPVAEKEVEIAEKPAAKAATAKEKKTSDDETPKKTATKKKSDK